MKDWLDKLSSELSDCGETPPKGFKSRIEIGKQLGYKSNRGASAWIRKAIDAGKLQRVIVRRPNKFGHIGIIPYYGPK